MDLELTNADYDGIVGYLRKNILATQRRSKKEQEKAASAAAAMDQESDTEALASPRKLKREPVVWTKEEVQFSFLMCIDTKQ